MCDDLTPERKSKKKRKLIMLLAQRAETEMRFLYMVDTCSTLLNNNGVRREVREMETM